MRCIDKMQWMSSQNCAVVEIRLDPAELGLMEIIFKPRGRGIRIQFVKPEPGQLREALEAQMFACASHSRKQGMDLVDGLCR